MEFGTTSIRVFVEPDDAHVMITTIRSFLNVDPKRITLTTSEAEGFDSIITIIECTIKNKKDSAELFERIIRSIDADEFTETLESRIDEGHCYLRIDKERFLESNVELVDHGSCLRFDFSILTYPRSRERCVLFIRNEIDRIAQTL